MASVQSHKSRYVDNLPIQQVDQWCSPALQQHCLKVNIMGYDSLGIIVEQTFEHYHTLQPIIHWVSCFSLFGYLVWAIFTLEPRVLQSILLEVHDLGHTHSLASFELSDQQTVLLTKTVYSARNKAPTKTQEHFLRPFVLKGEKSPSQYRLKRFYSHTRQQPCAQHVMIMPGHLPLSHPFC